MGPHIRLAVLAAMAASLMAGCGRGRQQRSLNEKAGGSVRRAAPVAVNRTNAEPADASAAPVSLTNRALEWDSREARMASVKLAEDVADLRGQLAEAQATIARLQADLADARSELDSRVVAESGTSPEMSRPAQVAARGMTRAEIQLLDVNEDLSLVVLDVGGAEGIMAGMQFSITRQKKTIGRVRVVDVREEIAGAVVEDVHPGKYPRKGDVAVLWSGE